MKGKIHGSPSWSRFVALQVRDLAAPTHLGWGVALWILCDDADILCATLQQQGIPITQLLFDGPFGRTFSCTDPDGYTLTIHSATHTTLADPQA